MNIEEYVASRLDDQIDFYEKRSRSNQRGYKVVRVVEIAAAGLIPLLAGLNSTTKVVGLQVFIGVLGFVVTLAAGIAAIWKFQENWMDFRSTAEALKHEKYAFLTQSAPYDTEDRDQELVERVESLVSTEHTHWHQRMATERKPRGQEGLR